MSSSRWPTPHARLVSLVDELVELSPGARVTLVRALRRASRRGGWDSRPHEGAFWIVGENFAEETGLSLPTLRRCLKELRDEPCAVLRWRIVYTRQPLPNGSKATRPICVFYVDLARLEARLQPGMNLARSDQVDHLNVITDPSATPRNPVSSDASPRSFKTFNQWLINHDHRNHARARAQDALAGDPDHGLKSIGDEARVGLVFDAWWEKIGSKHQPHRFGWTCDGVRKAIVAAFAARYSTEDLLDAVDAASDKRIGGAYQSRGETPFEWCRRNDVWGRGVFEGSLDKLLRSARMVRERDAQRAIAASTLPQESRSPAAEGGSRPEGWQRTPTAAELEAELARAKANYGGRRS